MSRCLSSNACSSAALPPNWKENLEAFQQSKTHEAIVSYINALNECVVGVKLTDDVPVSSVRKSLLITYILPHVAPGYLYPLSRRA